MVTEAHTFHPSSNSFEDRLDSLRLAVEQLIQARSCLNNTDERLGDEQEKRDAVTILGNSLNKAMNSFSTNELLTIKEDKLLSQESMTELISAQRTSRMKSKRQNTTDDQHTLKR